jgi:hypothetical protein
MKTTSITSFLAVMALFTFTRAMAVDPVPMNMNYGEPMRSSYSYVQDPRVPIREGLKRYSWTIVDDTDQGIRAMLDNYKGREAVVDIKIGDGTIAIVHVSDRVLACTGNCSVEADHLTRWLSNLRRGIARAIHEMAIADARSQLEGS